eukprot:jgi/Ulvmu1/1189/UM108_0017.1
MVWAGEDEVLVTGRGGLGILGSFHTVAFKHVMCVQPTLAQSRRGMVTELTSDLARHCTGSEDIDAGGTSSGAPDAHLNHVTTRVLHGDERNSPAARATEGK